MKNHLFKFNHNLSFVYYTYIKETKKKTLLLRFGFLVIIRRKVCKLREAIFILTGHRCLKVALQNWQDRKVVLSFEILVLLQPTISPLPHYTTWSFKTPSVIVRSAPTSPCVATWKTSARPNPLPSPGALFFHHRPSRSVETKIQERRIIVSYTIINYNHNQYIQ